MSLDLLTERLAWPEAGDIRRPPGEGARIFADLAKAKLGSSALRGTDDARFEVGVLARNPGAAETEPPLAVVAEFQHSASDEILRELHRLSWNFSHSPTLVTVEPHLLRIWTCCEPPKEQKLQSYLVEELSLFDLSKSEPAEITKRAIHE